jgi:hypothetical protein
MSHVHLHMTRNGLYLYGDLSIRQSSSSVNAFDSEPVKTFCYSVHRFPHTSSSQCNQQIRVYATSTNYKGLPGAVLFLTSIQWLSWAQGTCHEYGGKYPKSFAFRCWLWKTLTTATFQDKSLEALELLWAPRLFPNIAIRPFPHLPQDIANTLREVHSQLSYKQRLIISIVYQYFAKINLSGYDDFTFKKMDHLELHPTDRTTIDWTAIACSFSLVAG